MGRHRMHTLMSLHGLRPVWQRKFVNTTYSKHTMAVSGNVLNRQFEQALPNSAGPAYLLIFVGAIFLSITAAVIATGLVGAGNVK